jgi:hypothetical protein
VTKAEVRKAFPALLAAWRQLPENTSTDEQRLEFGDFWTWLVGHHPGATKFRSTMGPREDLEQWFAQTTHQTWRD